MALTKYKLGSLIEQCDERNTTGKYTAEDIRGISTGKEFIETKANLDGVSLTSYKVVKQQEFAYVADTSRRGEKIAIAFNNNSKKLLISSIYTVFRVSRVDLLLSDYLFMYFNRPEFDRFSRFNSWGSARETFNWEDMCDIDIDLPDLSTQQKYVDIYLSMVANQQSYERGLDDLKLMCDARIDMLNNCYRMVGDFVEKNQKKNQDRKFTKAEVKGFNNYGQFIKPMRLFSGDVSKCTILQKNDFVYNLRVNSTIERLSIAINECSDLIVSPDYESFYVKKGNELFPYYLYMLLQRDRFAKKVLNVSLGSSTTYFRFNNLCEIQIPVPEYSKQVEIATIYRTYKERWTINEKLKAQIKDICPILIKGSLEENQDA